MLEGQTELHPGRAIHEAARVIDAHSDISADVVRLRSRGETDVFGRIHLDNWHEGGVNGAIATVGGDQLREPTPFEYAMATIATFKADLEERPEELGYATDAASFEKSIDEGRVTFAFSVEGSSPIEGSIEKLERLHGEGLQFVGLTWSAANEVGAGVGHDGALTAFGRQAIQRMAELKMVVDVSHANEQTFWEAIELETGNLVASHSNARAVHDHPRNLTDDQLRALAAQGGFAGTCIFTDHLPTDDPGISEVVDEIVYVASLVGVEHVALGLDYFDFLPEEEAMARLNLASIPTATAKYPDYVRGLEGIQRLPALSEGLHDRGMAGDEISLVLGGNILRVWRRINSGQAHA